MNRSFLACMLFFSSLRAADTTLPVPDANHLLWHEAEIGLFIHWAPNVYQNREGDNLSTPPDRINPAKLDTDEWARAATAFGAKYVVLVAKHVGGYCLWQTDTTDYSIKTSPWKNGKGDVMADMAASCEKHGLHMGFYLSPRDDKFGAKIGGVTNDPARQEAYNRMYHAQLTELLTRYGPMLEVWFDGTIKIPVEEILKTHAPKSVTFQGPTSPIRWIGNEHGVAPYPTWNRVPAERGLVSRGTPDGDLWVPAEVDVSLRRPYWFWSSSNAGNLLTLDQLMEIYYKSVGHGANLLLNITPDREGAVPEADMKRLEEFGAEIKKRFGKPLAATHGTGNEILLTLPKATAIDHIQLREDIKSGEQVRVFTVEGRSNGEWIPLATGSAIGNRQIIPVSSVIVDAVRLNVTETTDTPAIRDLSVFHTNIPLPQNLFREGTRQPLVAPVINRAPDGTFSINLPQPDWETRYTTDGTEPTLDSPSYHEPQPFGSGTIRARFFRQGATLETGPETLRRYGLPTDHLKIAGTSSAENGHPGENAIDANPRTMWHTPWRGGIVEGPHEIVIDLGSAKTVKAVSWMPRQDLNRDSGQQPREIHVHIGDTPDTGVPAHKIDPGAVFKKSPLAEQWFDLPQPRRGRYVRLVVPSNLSGRGDLATAEIQIDAE